MQHIIVNSVILVARQPALMSSAVIAM